MKPEELKSTDVRIGNTVYTKLGGGKWRPCALDYKDISFIDIKGQVVYKPIPLTEDWLIKFGLEKMKESEYTINTYNLLGFKLWINKGKFLFNDSIEIKYVHRLQNLAYDLGKELTTKK